MNYIYIPGYTDKSKSGCINPNEVYVVEHNDEKVCFMKVDDNVYTIIDYKHVDKIRQYAWYLHKHTGYICHTVSHSNEEMKGRNYVYLHQYVHMYCEGIECPEKYSVDHVNRIKTDNRAKNLRSASQSLQNENRERVFANRQEPHDELKAIGITHYPKHLRYDNSQGRFLIEKHPGLPANKTCINGTRSGSIINRYYDIVKTGSALENVTCEYMQAWKEYREVVEQFTTNHHIKLRRQSEGYKLADTFVLQCPDLPNTFTDHTMLIDMHVARTGEDIIQDKNILYSDAAFTLTRDMMPKYVSFSKEKVNKKGDRLGSSFKHEIRKDGKRVCTPLSSSSVFVSTKEKYENMLVALRNL